MAAGLSLLLSSFLYFVPLVIGYHYSCWHHDKRITTLVLTAIFLFFFLGVGRYVWFAYNNRVFMRYLTVVGVSSEPILFRHFPSDTTKCWKKWKVNKGYVTLPDYITLSRCVRKQHCISKLIFKQINASIYFWRNQIEYIGNHYSDVTITWKGLPEGHSIRMH